MTVKQNELISELIASLPENDKAAYKQIIDYVVELGYIPQKQGTANIVLSFKHKVNKKVIAKIGVRNQLGYFSVRYFACKDVPEKYIKILCDEFEANRGKYSFPVPLPDPDPVPPGVIMKKCTASCNVCTGGKMRYYYKLPNGEEIFRCGAYPISIPDVENGIVDELKQLILQQHDYFLSIAQ